MRPSTSSAENGGYRHAEGSPSVTTSVWPSSKRLLPAPFSPRTASTFGRPGATGCTSTSKPSLRNQRSTYSATAASVAPGSPARTTLGILMRSRVSSTSSSASTWARTSFSDTRGFFLPALLGREREDHGVEADHAVLVSGNVEVVPLDLLGALLERHHGLDIRHLAKGVGALVEAVSPRHDFTVANRRSLRAMDAHETV